MNRPHVIAASALAALLALLQPTSLLADPPAFEGADDGVLGDAAETMLTVGVADGTGLIPGVRLELLGTGMRSTTGANGTALLRVPLDGPMTLRATDEDGYTWTASIGILDDAGLPEGALMLLDGTGSRILLAGPDQGDVEAFDQALEALQAEWDAVQPIDDVQARTPVVGGRPVARRVSPWASPLPRFGSARTRFETIDAAEQDSLSGAGTSYGLHGGSLDADEVTLGGVPQNPPRSMVWTGESEPNGSTSQCNVISSADFGAPLSPQDISTTADVDFYCFSPACGDNVTITITPSGTLRPRLDLFHSTGNTLATSNQFSVTPATVTLTSAEAIGYAFSVRSNSSTTGSYTITITTTAGTCIVDPNEPTWGTDETGAACATPPAPGARSIDPPFQPSVLTENRAITWAGTLSTARDIDTYCLNMTCGQGLNVTVVPGNATMVMQVKLIAPVLVTSSSTTYVQRNGTAGATVSLDAAPAIVDGQWKVEITTSGANKGTYAVSFSRFAAPYACTDAYEPDNGFSECRPIPTDGTRQSHVLFPVWNGPAVGGTEEGDWVCFEVNSCGSRVVVETLPSRPEYDVPEPSVTVYGPDGSAIVSDSSSGHRTIHPVASFIAQIPGLYYAKVFATGVPPYTNDSAGQYDILVNVVDAKAPLSVPVTETLNPDNTVLAAEALSEETDPAWLDSIAPGPGAVDIGSLPGQTFGPNLNGGRYTTAVPLPFTFPFFGVPKTQVRISEAGYFTFNPAASGVTFNSCIPDTINNVNDAVYAFWDSFTGRRSQVTLPAQELVPGARVTAETRGTPGSREWTVTWYHLAKGYGSVTTPTGDHSFSATLEEATGNIVLRYGRMMGHPDAQGQSATIGLENANDTQAVVYGCYQPLVEPGLVLTFVPNGAGSYALVTGHGPKNVVDYPTTTRSCQYDISVQTVPYVDIASTGTPITAGATVGVNWTSYGPFPWNPPNPNPVPAPLAATQLDEGWVTRTIPWASGVFPFHRSFETSFLIHMNGFLAFGVNDFNGTAIPTDHARSNQCPLPFMGFMNGVVAPFWDDLFLSPAGSYTGGQVYEKLDDPPGPDNARYIVQWTNAQINAPGSTGTTWLNWRVNFQLILHESGLIEFAYGDMGGATPHPMATGTSATVGVESPTGGAPYHGVETSGTTYWCGTNNAAAIAPLQGPLHANMVVRFAPHVDMPPVYEWRDAATDALLGTGPQFVADETTPCRVRLYTYARDPKLCCTTVDYQEIDIEDRFAPVVTFAPELTLDGSACNFLWPPSHGYVDFDVSQIEGLSDIVATDACGNGVFVELGTIVSSQPEESVDDLGDGESYGDAMISPDLQHFSLRAERAGGCAQLDRSYTVVVRVRDSLGNSRDAATLPICVYHDRGSQPPGPYFSANPDSNQSDSRPGWINGQYGTGCGDGCSMDCDPTQSR